jgi:BASS family bile acid:Na+ symporter
MENTNWLMPLAIAVIMYGIGLTLRFKNFKRVFIYPKSMLLGLGSQVILLPIIAFLLAWILPIDPLYKVGLVLIASAPGGTASNLVTAMLKGRVALSVSMTSFNSFIILVSIPFYVSTALYFFMGETSEITLSVNQTLVEILQTVVIPVILGVLTNEYGPERVTNLMKKPLRVLLPALLLGVFAYALFFDDVQQSTEFLGNIELLIPLVFFNFLTMSVGYKVAQLANLKVRDRYTIAVEMGLQNAALAIYIATQVLESPEISLVAILYSSFTFFSTWGIGWLMKHFPHVFDRSLLSYLRRGPKKK